MPAIQAAGHPGAQQENGLFIKPSCKQEASFYEWVASTPLADFVPTFMGTLTQSTEDSPFVVLEDLCQGFKDPAVMDVKLGSILHDDECLPEKKLRLQKVSNETTSGSLHFRIAGMTLLENNERIYSGKEFGREANSENIISKLARFFPNLDDEYMYSICANIIEQLKELKRALQETRIEMHSASVLFIYEGNAAELHTKVEKINADEDVRIVDVRLIDFAHSKSSLSVDEDSLTGVTNLLHCLEQLQNGKS